MRFSSLLPVAVCLSTLVACGQKIIDPAGKVETPSHAGKADPNQGFADKLNTLAAAWEPMAKTNSHGSDTTLEALGGITAAMEGISIEGLPNELAVPFSKVIKAGKAIGPLMAKIPPDVPKDPVAAQTYLQENPEVMKKMTDLQEEMILLQTGRNRALSEFGAAAEKLGIDVKKFLDAALFTGKGKSAQ